jgi:hypothetical protein
MQERRGAGSDLAASELRSRPQNANDTPRINERVAARGRIALDGGDEQTGMARISRSSASFASSIGPRALRRVGGRGERRSAALMTEFVSEGRPCGCRTGKRLRVFLDAGEARSSNVLAASELRSRQ